MPAQVESTGYYFFRVPRGLCKPKVNKNNQPNYGWIKRYDFTELLSALINYPQYKEIVKILHFTTPLNVWFSKMLILADKNSKIIPERVKDDTKRAYVKQLLEYANNINSTEDADASIRLLLKQRIIVMLKSQQQDFVKKQAIIAEKTLGNTTDPIILLEFDKNFRRDMEDFMNNINNVKQQLDKLLA